MKPAQLRWPEVVVLSIALVLLTSCDPAASTPMPTAAAVPTPELSPYVVPTPEPTAAPPTVLALPGTWRRITSADGLCTDRPYLIGWWYIGTKTSTICYPTGPLRVAGTTWVNMTLPIGTQATAAAKFPPGGGLIVATDAGDCTYWPGPQPGDAGTWECRTPADGSSYADIRGMTNLGVEAVFMLPNAVAYMGQVYHLPDLVGAADARPTWIAASGNPSASPRIWIATNGYGVVTIHPDTGQVIRYTTADGLPGNTIRDINVVETKGGQITAWVATDGGIARGDGLAWTGYTTADGLVSNDVRGVSGTTSTVWAATAGGAAYFDGSTWYAFTPTNGLPEGDLSGVLAWEDAVWFSTRGQGLLVFILD